MSLESNSKPFSYPFCPQSLSNLHFTFEFDFERSAETRSSGVSRSTIEYELKETIKDFLFQQKMNSAFETKTIKMNF
jgi:hypothetical protein